MVGIDIIRGGLLLQLFTNEFSLNTPHPPDTIKYQLNTLTVYWLWCGMIVSGRGWMVTNEFSSGSRVTIVYKLILINPPPPLIL